MSIAQFGKWKYRFFFRLRDFVARQLGKKMAAIIRVKRRLDEDPAEGLIVQYKRCRTDSFQADETKMFCLSLVTTVKSKVCRQIITSLCNFDTVTAYLVQNPYKYNMNGCSTVYPFWGSSSIHVMFHLIFTLLRRLPLIFHGSVGNFLSKHNLPPLQQQCK